MRDRRRQSDKCLTRECGGLAQPLAIIEGCKRVVKFTGKPAKAALVIWVCSAINTY